MVVVTGAVVLVVVEAPTVDVDDVGGGEVELVQAASVRAMTTVTTITTSLRTVIIVLAYTLGTFNGCQVRPPLVVRHIRSGGPTPERPSTSHILCVGESYLAVVCRTLRDPQQGFEVSAAVSRQPHVPSERIENRFAI